MTKNQFIEKTIRDATNEDLADVVVRFLLNIPDGQDFDEKQMIRFNYHATLGRATLEYQYRKFLSVILRGND